MRGLSGRVDAGVDRPFRGGRALHLGDHANGWATEGGRKRLGRHRRRGQIPGGAPQFGQGRENQTRPDVRGARELAKSPGREGPQRS